MRFAIEVGEVARQQVEFYFNQLLGLTVIRANGREIKKRVRLFSEPVKEAHELDLDGLEKLRVRIEKHRQWLISSRYLVFVNDRLVQRFQGV
ncbi:hypothetical protein NXS98_11260 [Fontisphaera persica]|jgi:hypothetical protein|uniref:hypothetical protein n=1 Tax=Fontisphaera persica TaxID=2974023 RepID=UPI0024C0511C|nr:hypothetical protein [Fontisphaera persica]WCJ58302.1 hypothetical protein NXS98_11260 [Fontisphaera persica]